MVATETTIAHTPGPWRTQRAGRSDHMMGRHGWNPDDPQQCARVVVSESRTLCRLPDPMPWLGDDELDANAKLMAAAPILLEIAKVAATLCDDAANVMLDAPPDPEQAQELAEALTQLAMDARAAIAAATGR